MRTRERFSGLVEIINLETARPMAPIITPENVIELLRQAVKDGAYLEYRTTVKTRKHASIDTFSCSAILTVYDALSPANRDKFIAMHNAHPGKMAAMAFKLL